MSTQIKIYTLDTFSAIIDWTNSDGSVKDLTGAQVVAVAAIPGKIVDMGGVVTDGLGGLVRVSAPSGALSPGKHQIQVRVTKNNEVKTVAFSIEVEQSLPAAT